MNYPKYITHGTTHYWHQNRQIWQAWYMGKATGTFATEKRALAKAKQIAESIKANYMNRGIRAQVVRVEPEWYAKKA